MLSVKTLNTALLIALLLVGCIHGKSGLVQSQPQSTCPVRDEEINKEIYTYYDDSRINFCCKGCISEFYQDPAKYVKKLEDEGVSLVKVSMGKNKKKGSQGTDERNNKPSASNSCGCSSQ